MKSKGGTFFNNDVNSLAEKCNLQIQQPPTVRSRTEWNACPLTWDLMDWSYCMMDVTRYISVWPWCIELVLLKHVYWGLLRKCKQFASFYDNYGSVYHMQNHDLNEPSSCVIYLHGNASSQLEGRFLVPNLCPRSVLVCCFDFAGCGRSGGDCWTLGYREREDVELIMNELHTSFNVNRFFLWGRSMGAGTAVMVRSPWLKGIIVDSGYSNVPELLKFIGGSKVPGCLLPGGLWVLERVTTENFAPPFSWLNKSLTFNFVRIFLTNIARSDLSRDDGNIYVSHVHRCYTK